MINSDTLKILFSKTVDIVDQYKGFFDVKAEKIEKIDIETYSLSRVKKKNLVFSLKVTHHFLTYSPDWGGEKDYNLTSGLDAYLVFDKKNDEVALEFSKPDDVQMFISDTPQNLHAFVWRKFWKENALRTYHYPFGGKGFMEKQEEICFFEGYEHILQVLESLIDLIKIGLKSEVKINYNKPISFFDENLEIIIDWTRQHDPSWDAEAAGWRKVEDQYEADLYYYDDNLW